MILENLGSIIQKDVNSGKKNKEGWQRGLLRHAGNVVSLRGNGGSNPSPSANNKTPRKRGFIIFNV